MNSFKPALSVTKDTIVLLLIIGSFTQFSCSKKCAQRLPPQTSKPVSASVSNSPKPELVVRRGHVGEISALALSPDGKLLASGGTDYQVKLWEVESGRMLRTLFGHVDEVISVQFSPSGSFLISTDRDTGTHILWNVKTGDKIKEISNINGFTEFSPDEKLIAYRDDLDSTESDTQSFLRVIGLPSGELVRSIKVPGVSFPRAFSLDNAYVSVEKDGATSLFNIKTGKFAAQTFVGDFLAFLPDGGVLTFTAAKLQRFVQNAQQEVDDASNQGTLLCGVIGKSAQRFSVAILVAGPFSRPVITSDGRTIAGWVSPDSVSLWSTQNGKLLRTLKVSSKADNLEFSPDGSVLILKDLVRITESFDTRSGKLLAKFKSNWFLAFSRDSSMVTVYVDSPHKANEEKAKLLHVLDVRTGRIITSVAPGSTDEDPSVFSNDGKLVMTSAAGHIDLWKVSDGTLSRRFDRAPEEEVDISFSDDWKSVTIYSGESDITIGQAKKLELDDSSPVSNIILREQPGKIEFYDRTSNAVVRTLPVSADQRYEISADKRRVAIQTSNKKQRTDVWNVENNYLLRSLPGALDGMTPNGKVVVTSVYGPTQGGTRLWDAETGVTLGRIIASGEVIAFSPDSKLVAVVSGGNGRRGVREISIYSAETGTELPGIEGGGNFSAEFSPDSQAVAVGGYYGTVELCDARSGKVIREFQDVGSSIPVAFSPNGRTLATYNSESGVRLWSIETGELLGSIVQFEGGNWLAITPDGLFDGTPTAWSQILWRFSRDTFDVLPVETFFADFYSPGLVTDLLAGGKPVAPRNIADLDRRPAQLSLQVMGQDSSLPISSRSITLQIQITNAPAGARDLRLFRNGTLVKTWRGELPLINGQSTVEASVKLVAGENQLTAYAFNRDNVKSLDASISCAGADNLKIKPTAYIFAIGVNDYSNPELNLKFAKADALVFSDELARRQLNLNQFDQIKVVTLLDKDSTKRNVLAGLNRLSSTPSELHKVSNTAINELESAEPEDTVIIYFAGHGTAFRNQFYLVPADIDYAGKRQDIGEENIACILERSISDRELETVLEGVEARNILLVIDSCNSGQMLEGEEKRRGPMNSKGLAQLAYEKGMFILTAAQSYQAALEADKLGHGFLTFALIDEGLKSLLADFDDKDGEITAREWLDYAAERVPQLQAEKMQQARLLNQDVVFVPGGEREYELSKRSLQVPRVFYRREIQPNRFIIAK